MFEWAMSRATTMGPVSDSRVLPGDFDCSAGISGLGGLRSMVTASALSDVTEACKRHGGVYLGSIGGAAARLAQDCITKVEVLEYPELGMEAVWKIEVRDFPAFIIVADMGNDFYAEASGPLLSIGSHPRTLVWSGYAPYVWGGLRWALPTREAHRSLFHGHGLACP